MTLRRKNTKSTVQKVNDIWGKSEFQEEVMNVLHNNMEEEEDTTKLCTGNNNFNRTGQERVQMFHWSKKVWIFNARKQIWWKQAKISFWGTFPLCSIAGDWIMLKGSWDRFSWLDQGVSKTKVVGSIPIRPIRPFA